MEEIRFPFLKNPGPKLLIFRLQRTTVCQLEAATPNNLSICLDGCYTCFIPSPDVCQSKMEMIKYSFQITEGCNLSFIETRLSSGVCFLRFGLRKSSLALSVTY
jgi:hypothetical protein